MFKPRRPRGGRNQPQNPISDMEQFYLNQYFQAHRATPTSGPAVPPEAYQNNHRFPPIEFTYLHQLEQRIERIEHYLGLSTESTSNPPPR